jgi:hypothetical protein
MPAALQAMPDDLKVLWLTIQGEAALVRASQKRWTTADLDVEAMRAGGIDPDAMLELLNAGKDERLDADLHSLELAELVLVTMALSHVGVAREKAATQALAMTVEERGDVIKRQDELNDMRLLANLAMRALSAEHARRLAGIA